CCENLFCFVFKINDEPILFHFVFLPASLVKLDKGSRDRFPGRAKYYYWALFSFSNLSSNTESGNVYMAHLPMGLITQMVKKVAHRLSTSKSTDDVTNILHRTYEVYMRIITDRKSQRTTVGQKARQADHLAWSEDPPFLRELYSLFPKVTVLI
ncbi:hypothetical protein SFRURICE_006201, partial [Spodoptera frugiperda]